MVRTTTSVFGIASRIWRVACSPSNSGMLISTMATSGFSLFAFSTASRPLAASPMTRQPRRAQRSPRMPRRTRSWSSATRIRSFLVPLVIYVYRHAHRCAAAAGFNIQPAANELHSLVHARDAHAQFEREESVPFQFPGGSSAALVTDLQLDFILAAIQLNLGLETSRMPLHVWNIFLNHPEQSHLDIRCHPSETR